MSSSIPYTGVYSIHWSHISQIMAFVFSSGFSVTPWTTKQFRREYCSNSSSFACDCSISFWSFSMVFSLFSSSMIKPSCRVCVQNLMVTEGLNYCFNNVISRVICSVSAIPLRALSAWRVVVRWLLGRESRIHTLTGSRNWHDNFRDLNSLK